MSVQHVKSKGGWDGLEPQANLGLKSGMMGSETVLADCPGPRDWILRVARDFGEAMQIVSKSCTCIQHTTAMHTTFSRHIAEKKSKSFLTGGMPPLRMRDP